MKNGTTNQANVIASGLSPFSKNWKKATRYIAAMKAKGLQFKFATFADLQTAAKAAGII